MPYNLGNKNGSEQEDLESQGIEVPFYFSFHYIFKCSSYPLHSSSTPFPFSYISGLEEVRIELLTKLSLILCHPFTPHFTLVEEKERGRRVSKVFSTLTIPTLTPAFLERLSWKEDGRDVFIPIFFISLRSDGMIEERR